MQLDREFFLEIHVAESFVRKKFRAAEAALLV
jgi:hypothetical protein